MTGRKGGALSGEAGSLSWVPWDESFFVGVRLPVLSQIMPGLARSQCVFLGLFMSVIVNFLVWLVGDISYPFRGCSSRQTDCMGCQEASCPFISSLPLPFCVFCFCRPFLVSFNSPKTFDASICLLYPIVNLLSLRDSKTYGLKLRPPPTQL